MLERPPATILPGLHPLTNHHFKSWLREGTSVLFPFGIMTITWPLLIIWPLSIITITSCSSGLYLNSHCSLCFRLGLLLGISFGFRLCLSLFRSLASKIVKYFEKRSHWCFNPLSLTCLGPYDVQTSEQSSRHQWSSSGCPGMPRHLIWLPRAFISQRRCLNATWH